jgi:hypothetical protein
MKASEAWDAWLAKHGVLDKHIILNAATSINEQNKTFNYVVIESKDTDTNAVTTYSRRTHNCNPICDDKWPHPKAKFVRIVAGRQYGMNRRINQTHIT